jgi:hypothetical protein
MRNIIAILLILLPNISFGQNEFIKYYPQHIFYSCSATSDSLIVCAGNKFMKCDFNGDSLYTVDLNHTYYNVCVTPYNEYILAGVRNFNMSGSGDDAKITKIDSAGNVLWSKSAVDPWVQEGDVMDVGIDHIGTYNFIWIKEGMKDMNVFQTDTGGNIIFMNSYNLVDDQYNLALDIGNDNSIYVVGIHNNANYTTQGFIAKLDNIGNLIDHKEIAFPNGFDCSFSDIVYVNDSAIFAYGHIDDNVSTLPCVVKFNSSLDSISSAVIDQVSFSRAMTVDRSAGVLYFLSDGPIQYDSTKMVFIYKTDYQLSSFSEKIIDSIYIEETGYDISVMNNGNLLISGYAHTFLDGFLTIRNTQDFLPVTVVTSSEIISEGSEIKTHCSGNIFYYSSHNKIRSAKIFSVSGMLMRDLHLNNNSGEIDYTELSAGVYFVNLFDEKGYRKTIRILRN